MVPPNSGCGWQTTAARAGGRSCAEGLQRIASRRPAGPSRKKLRESWEALIDASQKIFQCNASGKKGRGQAEAARGLGLQSFSGANQAPAARGRRASIDLSAEQ